MPTSPRYHLGDDVNLKKEVVKDLAEYSLMALFSSIIGSYVYLSIRNNVIENLSFEKAGYWEAITRISGYYFLFLTTILTVFFLPKLSKSKKETWNPMEGCFFKSLFWPNATEKLQTATRNTINCFII